MEKEVKLPSGITVKISDNFTIGDLEEVSEIEGDFKKGIRMAVLSIKEWDFKDKDGKVLPINDESFRKLSVKDGTVLMNEITKVVDFGKKK